MDGNKPATHTPTPWSAIGPSADGSWLIGRKGSFIGQGFAETFGPEATANAEFIVRAVNNHYRLINALKNTHLCATYDPHTGKCGGCFVSTLLADVEAK